MMTLVVSTSRRALGRLATSTKKSISSGAFSNPSPNPDPPPPRRIARKLLNSPFALKIFMGLANTMGYNSSRQVAGRRAFALYEQVCAVRADEDCKFWRTDCHLPPTFQSWFTVTNLHIWLLTVRFRALQPPHGDAYIQGLIDHFFIDVEDRIRVVLQPSSSPYKPYTFISSFYSAHANRGRAPDRLVIHQMKIFKEQWAGMGMSFDLGAVKGDMEMAGAVWRNFLGARGARGIAFASPPKTMGSASTPSFRRSINLVGGLVEDLAKIDQKGIETEEAQDDYSGVHDYMPTEAEKYLSYPEVMLDIVTYVRRELARLDRLGDEEILQGDVKVLKFGRVKAPCY